MHREKWSLWPLCRLCDLCGKKCQKEGITMPPNLPSIMRTPRTVEIELTSQCNLRCRYCYFFENPSVTYQDISTDEWLRFFDECGQCKVMNVTLAGGEPLMRKDFPTLLDGIVRNRMRFAILSNGALLDDALAEIIAKTGRCDYVQISLDGAMPETHDICRGQGAFEGAMRGIHILQRHALPVTVRATIHRQNVRHLEQIARLILEDLQLPEFSTNAAGYLGVCRHHPEDMLLTIQERQFAMQTLSHLAEQYNGRISAMAGPLAEIRHWRQMIAAKAQELPPFPNGGFLTGCGCPASKIAVRSDGTFIPCPMLTHIALGQINQDSLTEVWQHSPALNRLRQRQTIPLSGFLFCKGCPYTPYCTGNCPGLAYSLIGHVNHPSPDSCLRRFLREGGTFF